MDSVCEMAAADVARETDDARCRDLERQVGRLERELAAVNNEIQALCYSVSHDLRAPLRAVTGFARIVREDQADRLDAEGRELLGQIEAAGATMNAFIDALVKLARLSRSPMIRQPVDLAPVAVEIADRLREYEPQRQVDFLVAGPLMVEGDPSLLRIVLDNLLSNAWKFSGKQPDARIEVGRLADTLFVRDNGVGFDPAYSARLFAPFQRLHTVEEFPGIGVGLAAVQRIVSRHGGRVWPEAAPGQGATFFFTLADDGAPLDDTSTGGRP